MVHGQGTAHSGESGSVGVSRATFLNHQGGTLPDHGSPQAHKTVPEVLEHQVCFTSLKFFDFRTRYGVSMV